MMASWHGLHLTQHVTASMLLEARAQSLGSMFKLRTKNVLSWGFLASCMQHDTAFRWLWLAHDMMSGTESTGGKQDRMHDVACVI